MFDMCTLFSYVRYNPLLIKVIIYKSGLLQALFGSSLSSISATNKDFVVVRRFCKLFSVVLKLIGLVRICSESIVTIWGYLSCSRLSSVVRSCWSFFVIVQISTDSPFVNKTKHGWKRCKRIGLTRNRTGVARNITHPSVTEDGNQNRK